MNAMVRYFENVPEQVRKRKIIVWLFYLAVTVLLASGISRATFDTSIEILNGMRDLMNMEKYRNAQVDYIEELDAN